MDRTYYSTMESTLTYLVRTESEEDSDWFDRTEIQSYETACLFMDWISYVHTAAGSADFHQLKEMGLDLFNHKALYNLYLNRKTFDPFLGKLAAYEGKMKVIRRLHGNGRGPWNMEEFSDEKELD